MSVKFLLHCNGTNGSTTFTDDVGHTISVSGNAQLNTTTKKFGTAAGSVSAGGYISMASADLGMTAGAQWSIDGWFYASSYPVTYNTFFSCRASNLGFTFGVKSGNLFAWSNTTGEIIGQAISSGSWHHIEADFDGTNLYVFVDGSLSIVNSSSSAWNPTSKNLYIGEAEPSYGAYFTGYFDEIRVQVGSYAHSGSFTPATSAYSIDANTSLLLHMDGTNGSTTFTDEAGNAVTAYGNAQISTAQSKFGGASGYFDGTGDYLSAPNNSSFNFGTGDFTVEFWLYTTVTWASQTIGIVGQKASDGTNGWQIYKNSGQTKLCARITQTNDFYSLTSPALNTWEHWAFARVGNLYCWFKNGVLETCTSSTLYNISDTSALLKIGVADSWASSYYLGYIDEVRITKGLARYPTFAVPTVPYSYSLNDPYWSNVSLLMHMDGVNNGTVFYDEKNNTITVNGNAKTSSTQSKFGITSSYYPDTTSYIKASANSVFDLYGVQSTIEGWIYPVRNYTGAQNGFRNIIAKRVPGTLTSSYHVQLWYNSNKIGFYNGSTSYLSNSSISLNTWSHFAIVNNGSDLLIFINGSLDSTHIGASFGANNSADLYIGSFYDDAATWDYFGGYIDEIRITKGVARYSSSFSVPSSPFPEPYAYLGYLGSLEYLLSLTSGYTANPVYDLGLTSSASSSIEYTAGLYVGYLSSIEKTLGLTSGYTGSKDYYLGLYADATGSIDETLGLTSAYFNTDIVYNLSATSNAYGSDVYTLGISSSATGSKSYDLGLTVNVNGSKEYVASLSSTATNASDYKYTTALRTLAYYPFTTQIWKLVVTVNGTDVSSIVTADGGVEITEGGFRSATFKVLPGSVSTNPVDWVGYPITIDAGRTDTGSDGIFRRIFTGVIVSPIFNDTTQLTGYTCHDNLKGVVGRLTRAQITTLLPGSLYSKALSGPNPYHEQIYSITEGFAYAKERENTLLGNFELDTYQTPRYTAWLPKTNADIVMTDQDIDFNSIYVQASITERPINRVRITYTHRYPRCKVRVFTYQYTYSYTQDQMVRMMGNIPVKNMFLNAVAKTGWELNGEPNWDMWDIGSYPAGGGYYTVDPNAYAKLFTGVSASLKKRYAQTIDSAEHIVIQHPGSVAAIGEESRNVSGHLVVNFDYNKWESDPNATPVVTPPISGLENYTDYLGTTEEQTDIIYGKEVLKKFAERMIVKAHRNNFVIAQTHFDYRFDVDKTVEINSVRVGCKGKLSKVRHEWSLDTGVFSTKFTVALTKVLGHGVPPEPVLPYTPDQIQPATPASIGGNTYVGNMLNAPSLQSTWHGFMFNCNNTLHPQYSATAPNYPVQFVVKAPAIESEYRNPYTINTPYVIDITMTEDTLTVDG